MIVWSVDDDANNEDNFKVHEIIKEDENLSGTAETVSMVKLIQHRI